MFQRLKDKLIAAVVDAKLRRLLAPEPVHEIIDDLIAMLHNGIGHYGLDPAWFDELASKIDKAELASMLSARLLHLLVGDGTTR